MNITFWLNGVKRQAEVRPDELLLDFLRKNSCYSVKRGCETANCGLCTVLMDERPVLSCSMLAARADGKRIVTLEGMQEEEKPLSFILYQRNSALLWQMREQSSVASAIRDLS